MNFTSYIKFYFITLVVMFLFILTLAGCEKEQILQYKVEIGEARFSSPVEVEISDINGDGIDEIIYLMMTKPNLNSAKPSIRVETFDASNSFDQINVSHYGFLNIWRDSNKQETFYGITYEEDFKVHWKEYNLSGEVTRQVEITDVIDKNQNGEWNGQQELFGFCDVNDDGTDDPIFYVAGDEVDELPRVIIAADGLTGEHIWDFALGPMIDHHNFHIQDVNNDGIEEFVFGTSATDNDVSLNGYPDDKCYLFVLRKDGTVLWEKQVGNRFSFCWIGAIEDIDGDGCLEIVYMKRSHDELNPDNDGLYIVDAETGELEKYSDSGEQYEPHILVADINRDGKLEILAITRSNAMIVFDNKFTKIREAAFDNFHRLFAGLVTDTNADGTNEIIIASREPQVIVLSENLEVIAKINGDPRDGFQRFFVAQNLKTNTNHLFFQSHGGKVSRFEINRNIKSLYYDYLTPTAIVAVLLAGMFLLILVRQRTQLRNEKLKVTHLLTGDAQVGIVLVNNNFYIEAANEAALKMIPEAFSRKPKTQLIDENLKNQLQALERTGVSKSHVEGINVKRDKIDGEIDVIAQKITKASGNTGGYVLNLFDKTVQMRSKLSEETVQIGQELMHKIKTLILVYSNDIYHLRNKLKNPGTLDHQLEVLDEMETVSRNIENISKTFMTLSNINQLDRQETDLNALLVSTIKFLADTENKSIEFSFNLLDSLEPIKIDREHIQSLIMNIVENALNAIDEKGTITVRTERHRKLLSGENLHDYFSFSVEDTGQGIEKSMIPRLFEPGITGKADHIGLGLTISRRIVDLHEGEIVIDSVVKKGTVVTIRLPY